MAFEDRDGATDLSTNRTSERLSLSYDTDDARVKPTLSNAYPVLLYVPNVDHHDHSHIALTDDAVVELQDWLTKYMKVKGLKSKPRAPK